MHKNLQIWEISITFAKNFAIRTMKSWKIWLMAATALVSASCAKQEENKTPITKPQITIEGGRLTPEALWAMGRIGSVQTDIETGLLAYTVSYYSVEENRSTTWIRVCNPYENDANDANDGLQAFDEFVGYDPAWFGSSGWLAYLKGQRRHGGRRRRGYRGFPTLAYARQDYLDKRSTKERCTMYEGDLSRPAAGKRAHCRRPDV